MPAFRDSKKPPLRAALLALLVAALTPLTVATGSADARTEVANPIADALEIPAALPVDPASLLQLVGTAQRYSKPALQTVSRFIVPDDQWASFDQIITHESNWQVFAINPTSGAYGLAQALPAHKMFSEGPDWMFNPLTQIRWAYRYMVARYGSPNAAWDFWQAHNWY
ncbi:hypothetical protein JMUB6875_06170 [Nocardia sp. JMUB6875]|uniref:aggregation-promoting factor C-terminal-like domain-containing protein n=1 Tax=Nocardia sp. JMUB6875 TaxID=3158170 RepID=UPI0032E5AA45